MQEVTVREYNDLHRLMAELNLQQNPLGRCQELQYFIDNHLKVCENVISSQQYNFDTIKLAKDFVSGYWGLNGG